MPDGQRLVFSSFAAGATGALFLQAANGTGTAQRLTTQNSSNLETPSAVSKDGTRALVLEGIRCHSQRCDDAHAGQQSPRATLDSDAVQRAQRRHFAGRHMACVRE